MSYIPGQSDYVQHTNNAHTPAATPVAPPTYQASAPGSVSGRDSMDELAQNIGQMSFETTVHKHHTGKRKAHRPAFNVGYQTPSNNDPPEQLVRSDESYQNVGFQEPTSFGSKTGINDGAEQLPNLAEHRMADQEHFRKELFRSWQHRNYPPPRATTDYIALDEGNSTPKFIRSSLTTVPSSNDIIASSGIPLAIYLQPLAQIRPEEGNVPIVNSGPTGPHRCLRCRTYINPFMQFVNGGAKIICNNCLFSSDVAEDYFFPCDNRGRRQDFAERPELQHGTIDFVVPESYNFKDDAKPRPIHWIFAIDVSEDAVTKGVVRAACQAIRDFLEPPDPEHELTPASKISIMTFDRFLYFYDIRQSKDQVSMIVSSDYEEAFVPLPEGHFVDPHEYKENILNILERIESIFPQVRIPEPALGALIESCICSLKDIGGRLNLFLSTLTTWGPGALRFREQSQLYGTENEKSLFLPQNIYWNKLSEKCVDIGLSVNQFIFPSSYADIASIGTVSSVTGGEIFAYFNFVIERDQEKLSTEFARSINREQGYQALMALRCSNGLQVSDYYGSFHQRRHQDIELSGVDADQGFLIVMKYDDKLSEKLDAYFQSALLYTSSDGRRMIRVHNLALQVSSSYEAVINSVDPDVLMMYFAQKAIMTAIERNLMLARDFVRDQCIAILTRYRKQCSPSANAYQLVLPDRLRTLPILLLGLLNCRAIRSGVVTSDVRVYYMRQMRRMSLHDISVLLYPQVFSIHDMEEDAGFPDESNLLILPRQIPLSAAYIEDGGVYLAQTGLLALLHMNKHTSTNLIRDVFAHDTLDELDARTYRLPVVDTRISVQMRNVMTYLNQKQLSKHLNVQLARQGLDGAEVEFQFIMIEDKSSEYPSYRDFLFELHRKVQTEIKK